MNNQEEEKDYDYENKIKEAQNYRQNLLTKMREAQERVDRLTILMYQRFIMETENWDDFN